MVQLMKRLLYVDWDNKLASWNFFVEAGTLVWKLSILCGSWNSCVEAVNPLWKLELLC